MDIMWKSPLLTADKRIKAREMVGALGGGKGVGALWVGALGGVKGAGVICFLQLCKNTEQLQFVLTSTIYCFCWFRHCVIAAI